MQIKKFEAKTMAEALRKVKQEFGPEAVILSARSVRKEHGVLGSLRSPKVEVTAAKDSVVAHTPSAELATGTYSRAGAAYGRHQPPFQRPSRSPSERVQIRTAQRLPVNRARGDSMAPPSSADDFRAQSVFEKRLLQNGVDRTLATQLWQTGATGFGSEAIGAAKEPSAFLAACIDDRGLVAKGLYFGDGRQNIVTLVGGSGVGKTTTLAKIASRQACRHNRRVAFISLDSYRIAANADLRVYSKILDVPLTVVSNASAFKAALRAFQDRDLVLVDTPACMPDQADYLNVLSILTSAGVASQNYLLLGASTREQELLRTIRKLDLLPLKGLIFTKLDECQTCGHLLNLLLRAQIPAAYVTAGYCVPEDIEALTADRLARLIVNPADGFAPAGAERSASATPEEPVDAQTEAGWFYVANKKTDLYHSPLCESAKRIKAANIERFETREAAEKERYQPCRLCIPDQSAAGSMPAQYAV